MVMVPPSGMSSSVTTDGAADTLPAGAESTKVAVLEDSLPGGDDNTFVFVYHRAGGMSDADRATVERHYNTLAKRYSPKVVASAGEDDEGPQTRPSTDGKAMMFTLDVSTTYGAPEAIVGPLRDTAKDRPAGLELDVTGPSAIDGDMDAVFDGFDLQVFLTTVVVVTLLLILTYRSPVLWLIPLVAVGAAALTAMATVDLLVKGFGIVVNDQNSALSSSARSSGSRASTTTSSWPAGPGRRPCVWAPERACSKPLRHRWRHHLGRPGPGGHVRGPRHASAGDADRGRVPGRLRRAARRPAGAVGPGARPHPADRPADVVAEPAVPTGGAPRRSTAARG